jgi:RNA polymerase sigma-70 factor (ECF subfamily)
MLQLKKDRLKELTDEEIIDEVKSGNIEYFSEIVKRHNQRMYRITVSYGIHDDDSEEVIQSAYISAYEKLNQFRGEAKFSTWLVRILINECLMMKRKKKKAQNLFKDEDVTYSGGNHLTPEREYMNKEIKEILESAIKQLPEKYRTAYVLKEVEGMSIEEASGVLDISKVNVKVRLHRAKSLLKEILKEVTDVSSLFTFGNERCDRVNDTVMNYIRKRKNNPA